MKAVFLFVTLVCGSSFSFYAQQNTSKADSTLSWYKGAKFGMFIHFDVSRRDPANWNPQNLNTDEWVRIAKQAGMKYMVPTTHQSSYIVMWDSKVSDRDVTDLTRFTQPYLKELSKSCKAEGLRMGAYYAIADPGNPLYNEPDVGGEIEPYVDYLHAVINELCEIHEPVLIWFDASRRFRDPSQKPFLRQQDMVDMLHTHGTLSNSRLGDDDGQHFVDYLTMNDNMAPNFNLGLPWESAVTISSDGSWHYMSEDTELRSTKDLLHRLINAAGYGGNLLLNVGPDEQGVIPQNMEGKLKEMGEWLEENGEAIYNTEPGPYPYQISWGTMTQKKEDRHTNLYLNILEWPENGKFTLFGLDNKVLNASLLASGEKLNFNSEFDAATGYNIITINTPASAPDEYVSVIKLVLAGEAVMAADYLQQSDGKVLLDAYNAHIHDKQYVVGKPDKAIEMKMFTTPDRRPKLPMNFTGEWDYQKYKKEGEGIMPGRGMTVNGFQYKGQALTWNFKIYEPGSYNVVVVCHAARNSDWDMSGSMRATLVGQSVESQLIEDSREETITMQKMVNLHSVLGTVSINDKGTYTLSLEIASDFEGKAPKFKGVILVPTN